MLFDKLFNKKKTEESPLPIISETVYEYRIRVPKCKYCAHYHKPYLESAVCKAKKNSPVRGIAKSCTLYKVDVSDIPREEIPVAHWVTSNGYTSCSICKTEGSPRWKCCPVCGLLMDRPAIDRLYYPKKQGSETIDISG